MSNKCVRQIANIMQDAQVSDTWFGDAIRFLELWHKLPEEHRDSVLPFYDQKGEFQGWFSPEARGMVLCAPTDVDIAEHYPKDFE